MAFSVMYRKIIAGCFIVLVTVGLYSCSDSKNLTEIHRNSTPQFVLDEAAALQAYEQRLITISGKVHDEFGSPLPNATISIVDSPQNTVTENDGQFIFSSLSRKNILLSITAPGYRTEFIPTYLQYATPIDNINLPTIMLIRENQNRARFLFGGDTAFGRRFLDPDESSAVNTVPEDDPEALILASDPEPGTRRVLADIRPFYQEADWGVLNFETPVTDNPATPHPTKDFVFFTLPGSLPALTWLGVDYVSSGNNHVYDYLETGLIDTINNLDSAGIPFSGAGLDSIQAFNAYRQTVRSSPYSFLSMTSIDGRKHAINYVAEANKGGAADLTQDSLVRSAIQREISQGHIPIVQLHTGDEYTFEPTNYVLNRINLAAQENAALAILHHPHVAQGVGFFNNMPVVLGLGNLAFDQSRLETMLSIMARVDMTGVNLEHLRLQPVYLESFAPKLISGGLANDFIRRLGEFSHQYDGLLYPYNGQGWVSLESNDHVSRSRNISINVEIPESGEAIVDLRAILVADESLSSVVFSDSLVLQSGRDLMLFGDFEDWDSDNDFNEAARWDQSGESRFVCMTHAFRDAMGLCLVRKSVNIEDSVVAFKNRIRVMGDAQNTPNKDLSLFGYYKGENAGDIVIVSRYFASFGDLEFGDEIAISHPGGSFDWQSFSSDLHMPADNFADPQLDARSLRIFLQHSPPETGDGLVAFDELAIIAWEDAILSNQTLDVPHAKDFLKVTGNEGSYQLNLQLTRYVPATSQ